MRAEDLEKPLPRWRRYIRAPLFPIIRMLLFALGFHWIHIRGQREPRQRAPVIIANHTCFVDPVFLFYAYGPSAVVRIETKETPVIGPIVSSLQPIYIDRTGTVDVRAAVRQEIISRAQRDTMPPVLVFPEATCTNQRAVISFKPGAFLPMRPVQPIVIRYPWSSFDPSWVYSGPGGAEIAMRMLCQFHNNIEVDYLPVIDPRAHGLTNPHDFARFAQRTMADFMAVPATQHSYLDVLLSGEAKRANYPPEKAVVELEPITTLLQVDADVAKRYLREFVRLDLNGSGEIDSDGFCRFFEEKIAQSALERGGASRDDAAAAAAEDDGGTGGTSEETVALTSNNDKGDATEHHAAEVRRAELRRLFVLLDDEEKGYISFREFLIGLAIINERGQHGREDALRLAFHILEDPDAGGLTLDHFLNIWRRVYPDVSDEELEQMFREADTNEDDVINEEEFMRFSSIHGDQIPHFRQVLLGLGSEEVPATQQSEEAPEVVLSHGSGGKYPQSSDFTAGGGSRLTRRGQT